MKILITKDALLKDSLKIYNVEAYFECPNLAKLASNGTVLRNHYTTAPSTAMSVTSMITSMYPYQFGRNRYKKVKQSNNPKLFSVAKEKGYQSIMIVPDNWISLVDLINAFDDVKLLYYDRSRPDIFQLIEGHLNQNTDNESKFFWIHLPHVIKPRIGYNSDIDLFDEFIGKLTHKYNKSDIYVSSDHGHMNLSKGIVAYGFDLYQSAINIPFITNKRLNNPPITSNIDLVSIIFHDTIPERKFIISETAYRLQGHRKIAVINNNYKLIFSKLNKQYQLYDYKFDKLENRNLLNNKKFDFMRGKFYEVQDINYYPHSDKSIENFNVLKSELLDFYSNENIIIELFLKIEFYAKKTALSIKNFLLTK